jgi:hypothetical protein
VVDDGALSMTSDIFIDGYRVYKREAKSTDSELAPGPTWLELGIRQPMDLHGGGGGFEYPWRRPHECAP